MMLWNIVEMELSHHERRDRLRREAESRRRYLESRRARSSQGSRLAALRAWLRRLRSRDGAERMEVGVEVSS